MSNDLQNMVQVRSGMVFAHPGHELPVAGLIQHYRPHLLFLTRSDSAGDLEREELALQGLRQIGLTDQATFLHVSEADIYRWLFAGEVAPFLEIRRRLVEWLDAVRPNLLFGDAFELSNIVHDVGRVLLDSAWRECRQRFSCQNFELPLVCRTEPEIWNLRFQEFPEGPFETYHLDDPQKVLKKSLADWVGKQREEAAMAANFFTLGREIFRGVPPDRDYTKPPQGLRLHYEDWGRLKVQAGTYQQPLLFADHFVPLVERLPWMTEARRTE